MIMRSPVQTAECPYRADATPTCSGVLIHCFVAGSYISPDARGEPLYPPQTIITRPVQTAVWDVRESPLPILIQLSCRGS